MFETQQEQLNVEIPIVSELMSIPEVNLEVDNDVEKAQEKLNYLVGYNLENLEFFKQNALSEESRLAVVKVDGIEYLAVMLFNDNLNLKMVLPITDINITHEPKDFGLKNFSAEDHKIEIFYSSIIFGYNGRYFKSVNPTLHNCEFRSKGIKTTIKKNNEVVREDPFSSTIDQYSDVSEDLAFNVHLPLNSNTVTYQIHEKGHYIDLRLACNTIKANGELQLLLTFSRSTGFVSEATPLDIRTLKSLKNLKEAEVRAWLYGNYFLRLIGNDCDLTSLQECISNLQSYDKFLAHQVLSTEYEGDIGEFFIFPETINITKNWINTYNLMFDNVSNLMNLSPMDQYIESLGITVKVNSTQWTESVVISGDNVNLDLEIKWLGKTHDAKWIEITWEKTVNDETIKKEYQLSLNNSKALDEIGYGTFKAWIDTLSEIHSVLTQC